jgi:hypothetical protein
MQDLLLSCNFNMLIRRICQINDDGCKGIAGTILQYKIDPKKQNHKVTGRVVIMMIYLTTEILSYSKVKCQSKRVFTMLSLAAPFL